LGIPTGVVYAKLENAQSGDVLPLTTRLGSGCHFTDRISHGRYEIVFRIDWTDCDANGDPCLDADFFTPGQTKPEKSMKAHAAHHTRKGYDHEADRWVYDFAFEGLALRFVLWLAREGDVTGSASLK
jgi:hypothetical protein